MPWISPIASIWFTYVPVHRKPSSKGVEPSLSDDVLLMIKSLPSHGRASNGNDRSRRAREAPSPRARAVLLVRRLRFSHSAGKAGSQLTSVLLRKRHDRRVTPQKKEPTDSVEKFLHADWLQQILISSKIARLETQSVRRHDEGGYALPLRDIGDIEAT